MATERYNPRAAEPKWQKAWDAGEALRDEERRPAPEILRARDVPLSVGAHPHGPCAQLHDGRRGGALQARRASTCCTRWAGTPSACRPRTPRATTRSIPRDWTYAEHRDHEGPAEDRWACRSTGRARFATCDVDLLPAPAEAVPRLLEGGAGLAQVGQGQLGPGRHDRARQRAGHRRPRLALRRAGRTARPDAVVLQDHLDVARTCSTALDTLDRWPEKVQLMQANWIGRSEGLLIRWPLAPAPRRPARRELEVYTTRPDTIFGASFMAIAADHPLARKAAETQSGARRLHRRDAAIAAPRRPSWRRPRRRASTPASASSIRSTRPGRCRSMSPISC